MVTRRDASRVASLFLVAGLLGGAAPGLADETPTPTLSSGSATQVGDGGSTGNGESGRGQVRLSGTFSGGGVDLTKCTFTIDEVLCDKGNDPMCDEDAELVREENLERAQFIGKVFTPTGGKRGVTFATDPRDRPSLKVRISDKLRGSLEFVLNVDRAVILSPDLPSSCLSTKFTLHCFEGTPGERPFVFDKASKWDPSGGTNIRTRGAECPTPP